MKQTNVKSVRGVMCLLAAALMSLAPGLDMSVAARLRPDAYDVGG